MSKKFGKFLLFSAVAGAAAYGAYQYLQSKDKAASPADAEDAEDDFDDFNEDLDKEPAPEKERSYVSLNLDKAAAIATESFQKAKEVIADSVQQVRDTVKSVTEGQGTFDANFTDLTALKKETEETQAEPAEAETEDFVTPEDEDIVEAFDETVPETAKPVSSDTPTDEETFFDSTEPIRSESPATSDTVEEFFDDTL